MAAFKILISSFILLFITTACATKTSLRIPEKYLLDDQLEVVRQVADVRTGRSQPAFTEFEYAGEDPLDVISRRETLTLSESENQWIKVDEQSFIIRSGANEYYLLVLNKPLIGLMGMETISFRLISNIIVAKTDYIRFSNANYYIDLIYKINGDRQMKAIRKQLM